MRDYKLVKEHPDHFEVDDGSGKPFRVPKDRLAHRTVQRIKQHFADGGEVQDDAELPPLDQSPAFKYYQEDQRAKALRGGAAAPEEEPASLQSMLEDMQDPRATPVRDLTPPATSPAPGAVPLAPSPAPAPPAPVQQPAPQMQLPPGDDTAAQIRKASADEAAALGQSSDTRAGGLRIQADIQQDAAQKQAAAAQWERQFIDTANAEQEAQFQKYLDPKNDINPHKWWESRTTGQKIAGAIGLALGGLGAGLTGGPNFALQIIDKEIERDLEAQKMNLGRKQNALTIRAGMTKDLLAGRHLAAADAYTAAAAMAAAQGTQTQSEMERTNAAALAAQLRGAAAEHVQAASARSLQMQMEKMNLAMSQQHMQAMGTLLKGLSGGGGFPRQVFEMPGFEKYRERAVDLPDGSVALADDTKQADEARDSMATVSRLKSKLTRYMDTLNNGSPETVDRGVAQEQHADLLTEMGHLHGLNRLSDTDLELFQQQVPDISRWLSLKALDRQKLRGVGKSIDDLVWSKNKALLHRPDAARPGGG